MAVENGGAADLLWGQRESPRRGPKPTLTLTSIADAGVAVADADGIAAVTMQRVAEALGVTKMALYRYVPGKAELVALMTDAALGAAPHPDAADWRGRLRDWAMRMFDAFGLHPWVLETTVGKRAVGPNEMSWLEVAIAALSDTGLDGAETIDVAVTLVGHVRTIAVQSVAAQGSEPEQIMQVAMLDVLSGREGEFPALLAALRSVAASGDRGKALEFGLDRILDGTAALIESRATGPAPRPRPGRSRP